MASQVMTGTVTINGSFVQTDTAGLISPIQAQALASVSNQFQNIAGTANAIDTLYAKQLTLAGAATHINLFAATDVLGNSVSFARVRFWSVQVVTLTAGFIVNIYTRTGTDPVTWLPVTTSGALWCPPGGIVIGYDPGSTTTNGFVVGSGAFDFTVDPGANTVVCNVLIAGNSAA
jgi:hypothetical protein